MVETAAERISRRCARARLRRAFSRPAPADIAIAIALPPAAAAEQAAQPHRDLDGATQPASTERRRLFARQPPPDRMLRRARRSGSQRRHVPRPARAGRRRRGSGGHGHAGSASRSRSTHDRTTVALNKSLLRAGDLPAVEQRFRAEHLHRTVSIPYDEHLAAMLDAGQYTVDALRRPTRLAIKQLGLAVAEQLV